MLKTLTIAILLGLTSGRPSADSGQEVQIPESKALIHADEELPNSQKNFMAQLEETPDHQVSFETLLRSRRASNSSMTNSTAASTPATPSVILIPLKGLLSVLSSSVIILVEAIFGLVSGILNPLLYLLTELLNPILLPLRPILNPILLPLNTLLENLLKALHLSLNLSGLLTGTVSNSTISAISSPNLSSAKIQVPPITLGGSATPNSPSQDRSRRSASQFPLSNEVITSRTKRQSPGTSIGPGLNSILSLPLTLVQNILSLLRILIISPLGSILSPIFSILHLPIDIISLPFNLIDSLLSNVMSLSNGIIGDIIGPLDNLTNGLGDVGLAIARQGSQMLIEMLSMPSTLADRVQNAALDSPRRRRSVGSTGLLDVILSFLSSPSKTLFNCLTSLLDHFNITYPTLEEAAKVFLSKAAKSFLTMAYTELKNLILPGVDVLLQSIVGSEYIPDYIKSAIAQFHTVYQLLKMVGYLRPS